MNTSLWAWEQEYNLVVGGCLLVVVCCTLRQAVLVYGKTINYQLSTINHQPSTINN
ncbi:MAG: hypothetical protein ACR9NN_09230 [Nostochopsis sp.]